MEVIKFNKKIYSLAAVKQAIEEFKDLADFNFKGKDDYLEVSIDNINKEYKGILKDEFCNYVLGVMS